MTRYRCFKRTWWKENPTWPNGLEPEAGERIYLRGGVFQFEKDAVACCKTWNTYHAPGRLSLKAEYEEISEEVES